MECININRLFPLCSEEPLLSNAQIATLSRLLTHQGTRLRGMASATSSIPAGYTYLGQFISHDIVPKTNPRARGRTVSPALNLDSVYGNLSSDELARYFDDEGYFKHNGQPFDVIRTHKKALIPEARNDENSIIVQLHRQLQLLHNRIVKRLTNVTDSVAKIVLAKDIVTTLFHIVVVNDFLRRLLDERVHNAYFKKTRQYILALNAPLSSVPIEFSLAAFRFGHSLVRNNYTFSKDPTVNFTMDRILRRSTSAGLQENEQIDWSLFFIETSQKANSIDMSIDVGLGDIPDEGNIVLINLNAANTLKLASGDATLSYIKQHFPQLALDVDLFRQAPLEIGEEAELYRAYQVLLANFSQKRLPLWLHVLHESRHSSNPFNALGKLGSIINAEVVRSSILHCYANRSLKENQSMMAFLQDAPPLQRFLEQTRESIPHTMLELIHFLK